MDSVSEWFPDGIFWKVDTPLLTNAAYKKQPIYYIPLTGYDLRKYEHEHHGKFGNNIGCIQHIAIMNRI